MRSTRTRTLYLAFFALFSGTSIASSQSPTIHSDPDVCALEPKAKVSDACASYADLDSLNNKLHPYIHKLASDSDFFSYYRLNLYNKVCPFWNDDDGTCGNIACAVTTLDNEEEIPEIWRAEELSRLEGPKAQHPGKKEQRERQRPLLGELGDSVGESCVVEYDDECDERDYCVPEDETATSKGDYVSLVDNPERFTGYGGESAHHIWDAIYRENCFTAPSTQITKQSSSIFGGFSNNQAQAANDLKQVINSRDDESALADQCLEKRVFYRIVSGMHASISTHLCDQYLNQTTGEWGPNLQCYKERLHQHPERISNLYFNYALVLRAVGKLKDYVQDYTFCTGDLEQDAKTRQMITRLASVVPAGPAIFDESVMFKDTTLTGIELKEDFRNRFRNISRVMDCVGCDKCRLWGKVQTNGYGTALKVLFEFGNGHAAEDKPILRRTEMVALINLLDKISSALKAVENFRGMIAAELDITAEPASSADYGYEDLDDLDEDAYAEPVVQHEESVTDAFWDELNLIFRAYVWVLKTWLGLPRLFFDIAYAESSRLFAIWVGKEVPVGPSWEWRSPAHEEL